MGAFPRLRVLVEDDDEPTEFEGDAVVVIVVNDEAGTGCSATTLLRGPIQLAPALHEAALEAVHSLKEPATRAVLQQLHQSEAHVPGFSSN